LPSTTDGKTTKGQDVFVPWVLSKSSSKATGNQECEDADGQVFNRYYHMFATGELNELAREAAISLGLEVAVRPTSSNNTPEARRGVEIIRDGWERSNWYIEMERWVV